MGSRNVYLAITDTKVHAWSSWSRWTEMRLRAERMGVRAEWTSTNINTKRSRESVASLERRLFDMWNPQDPCADMEAS